MATDGGGGAEGELPWLGKVDAEGEDLLVGDVRFRSPDGAILFVGTEDAHGDWTPSIPGLDLVASPGTTLEVGLVNPVGRTSVMGVDLATAGDVPVRLEVFLLAGEETLHAFEHVVAPGEPAFLGVWAEAPFDLLPIRQVRDERSVWLALEEYLEVAADETG